MPTRSAIVVRFSSETTANACSVSRSDIAVGDHADPLVLLGQRAVDLEDVDAGELGKSPSPVIESCTKDHQLPVRSRSQGIVDCNGASSHHFGARADHLELHAGTDDAWRCGTADKFDSPAFVVTQQLDRDRVVEPVRSEPSLRRRAALADEHCRLARASIVSGHFWQAPLR
jgi:hypothetical protein